MTFIIIIIIIINNNFISDLITSLLFNLIL